MSLWSGQAGALARDLPAGELIETLMQETRNVIARLYNTIDEGDKS
jgi:ketopantoate reductase